MLDCSKGGAVWSRLTETGIYCIVAQVLYVLQEEI